MRRAKAGFSNLLLSDNWARAMSLDQGQDNTGGKTLKIQGGNKSLHFHNQQTIGCYNQGGNNKNALKNSCASQELFSNRGWPCWYGTCKRTVCTRPLWCCSNSFSRYCGLIHGDFCSWVLRVSEMPQHSDLHFNVEVLASKLPNFPYYSCPSSL